MTYPYTNKEIQEISDIVANKLSGFINADNRHSEIDYSIAWSFIIGWKKQDDFWELFSNHAIRHSSLARDKGLCRDMLSGEQRAIATSAIHRVLARASDILKASPEYEKYLLKEMGSGYKSSVDGRDWDIEQRLKNIRNHNF